MRAAFFGRRVQGKNARVVDFHALETFWPNTHQRCRCMVSGFVHFLLQEVILMKTFVESRTVQIKFDEHCSIPQTRHQNQREAIVATNPSEPGGTRIVSAEISDVLVPLLHPT
jgi:hypothetical protein